MSRTLRVSASALRHATINNGRQIPNSARAYHIQPRPEPLQLPTGCHSLVSLINTCSNLVVSTRGASQVVGTKTADGSLTNEEVVIPFRLSAPHHNGSNKSQRQDNVGLLRPQVVDAIINGHVQAGLKSPWSVVYPSMPSGSTGSGESPAVITFSDWVNGAGPKVRTSQVEKVVRHWKQNKMFEDILRGWSNEAYPVYNPPPRSRPTSIDPVAFSIERAALPLFGFPNFGSLLIAYFRSKETNRLMLWIPRRSMNKRTWPGRLDVTVGGGIGLGDTALSTIIRECAEEASMDPTYVAANVHPVGIIPFPNRSPANWILPGLYYTFDLPLPADGSVSPRVNAADGEVDNFELMDVETVLDNLVQGKFKSSSALAIVDFLIRHGFITEHSDPQYVELCRLLRRPIDLPTPWR